MGPSRIPLAVSQNASFFTPLQSPRAGVAASDTSSDESKLPKLLQSLKIRGLTLQNRIILSPLCQYSASDGHLTDWHLVHLGAIIQRGPGLSWVECTAVSPEGRITPWDSGLWKDSQMDPLRRVVDYAHSQGQKIGIQLSHAGRKGSTHAPWVSFTDYVPSEMGGWPDQLLAPSAISYDDTCFTVPKAMTKEDITLFKDSWASAVRRAIDVGFDTIMVHSGHGYLLSSFLHPASNRRQDEYGGSLENRLRLPLEIAEMTRQIMPASMPLFVKFSAADWLEEVPGLTDKLWGVEDSIVYARKLAELGVDAIDIASGGMHASQKLKTGDAFQAHFALSIKQATMETGLRVSAVGRISNAKLAEDLLERGIDLVLVGRGFQKNPGLVWSWAEELGVSVKVSEQVGWGFGGPFQGQQGQELVKVRFQRQGGAVI